MQRPLEGRRGGHRVAGAGEDGEVAVSLAARPDHCAAVPLDGPLHELVQAGEGRADRLGVLLPEPGAPLDIAEEEGDRPGRQVAHGSLTGWGPTSCNTRVSALPCDGRSIAS